MEDVDLHKIHVNGAGVTKAYIQGRVGSVDVDLSGISEVHVDPKEGMCYGCALCSMQNLVSNVDLPKKPTDL